ncbi:MAG: hypothetical protein D3903_21260 [Candidatus Electrothrix sp. GM3_4]|nr:hypothetical protein [Candidatus Electrothrix sp. GM3_4]
MGKDKFDKMFEETVETIGHNTIDFKKDDIDGKKTVIIPPKSGTKVKTQKQDKRIVTYLTESEYEAFIDTFEKLDKIAPKAREAILEYIRKRQK